MIARHLDRAEPATSNYSRLVQYLVWPQNKHERVGAVTITNCHSDEAKLAALEVLAVQALNRRAIGDKTYHLLISFPPGEVPEPSVLKAIEETLCERLGFVGHQRISVVHHDTDHLHVHVAVNAIHPTRRTIQTPHNDYHTLGRACDELEQRFGLQRVNHEPQRGRSAGAHDMESHSGVESLVTWIQRECLPSLRAAQTWQELHLAAEQHGLRLEPRGAGCVLTNGQVVVKASSVAREVSFGALTARLGPYVARVLDEAAVRARAGGVEETTARRAVSTSTKTYQPRPMITPLDTKVLFAQFQAERARGEQQREMGLRELSSSYARDIEVAKHKGRLRRAAIKIFGRGNRRSEKRVLYAAASAALRSEIAAIREQHQQRRLEVYGATRRSGWTQWLQEQASAGNALALRVLRARDGAKPLRGNVVAGDVSTLPAAGAPTPDAQATKAGVLVYRVGRVVVREDAQALRVGPGASAVELRDVLARAVLLHGPILRVDGDQQFRRSVVEAAAVTGLALRFEDAQLEEQRQTQRRNYEQRWKPNTDVPPTRAAPEPDARGATGASSEWQNGLRELPARRVVQHGERREGVLPRDVSGHLVSQGAQRDQALRRAVSALGATPPSAFRSREGAARVAPHSRPVMGPRDARSGVVGREPPPHVRAPVRQSQSRSAPAGAVRRAENTPPPHVRQPAEMRLQGEAAGRRRSGGEAAPGQQPQPVGPVGRAAPPPRSRHQLQPLSRLGELRADRTESLRSGQQATPASRGGAASELDPVVVYVQEREGKRRRGLDVPKHRAWAGQGGQYVFAGRRVVAGCSLVLLERGGEIFVVRVPDDKHALWARPRLGRMVNVDVRGQLRGRSR